MIYKKKKLILTIFLIISIQFLMMLNNREKTSFRYFIWNIQEVSIGRLIFISFFSGLLMSSLLNKTLDNNIKPNYFNDEDVKKTYENDDSINREDINETYEITPERDLRDPQPTISVNYRVIKNNGDNELKGRNQTTNNSQYADDDWNDNDFEW